MNKQVTATGMKVKATTSSSIVIAENKPVGTLNTIAYGTAVTTLIPATYDSTRTSNLKYNTNPEEVSPFTGIAAGSTALTFDAAENVTTLGGEKYYYVDYVCYIASAGTELTGQKLVAYLYKDSQIQTNTQKAVTVDFYYATEETTSGKTNTDGDYLGDRAGSLNLSALSTPAGASDFESTTLDIPVGQIPVNNSTTDYLRITMRVYFDGALTGTRYQKTSDTSVGSITYYTWNSTNSVYEEVASPVDANISTYFEQSTGCFVYTDSASTADVTFNVNFTAVSVT